MTLNANKVPFSGGSRAEPLEPGNYPARVVQVLDLGLQAQRPYEGQEKAPAYEIMVTYELGTEFMVDDDGNPDETRPRWVSERFALYPLASDRAKSTNRYKVLDPKIKYEGDWSQLIGAPCLVAVVNNKNKHTGKVYNNVGGISAPIKGMDVPELVNEGVTFDLSTGDTKTFKALPEWIQELIKSNLEFKGSAFESALIKANGHNEEPDDIDSDPVEIDDDDVPF